MRHLFAVAPLLLFGCLTAAVGQGPYNLDSVVQVISADDAIPADSSILLAITTMNNTSIAKNLVTEAKALLTSTSLKDLSSVKGYLSNCNNDTALILHTTNWKKVPPVGTGDSSYSLQSSQYTAFSLKQNAAGCDLIQQFGVNYQPLIYAKRTLYFIGINYFDKPVAKDAIQISYKLSETSTTPQNIQDLGVLVAALVGFTVPGPAPQGAEAPKPCCQVFVAGGIVKSTAHLPYQLTVTYGLQPNTSNLPDAPVSGTYNLDLSNKFGPNIYVDSVSASVRNPDDGKLQPVPLDTLGLTFSKTTQVLSGSPKAFGSASLEFTLKERTPQNVPAPAGSKQFTLNSAADGGAKGATKPGKGQQMGGNTPTPGQPVDCSQTVAATPCSFAHTLAVQDREYWDVGLGLAIPGVVEAVYTPSGSPNKLPGRSVVTHTDAYAFFDFYMFAKNHDKLAFLPHINGGIPITSQPLHRPYVGVSWDISGWAQRRGFPLDFCVFGGVVFMKQQIYDPGQPNDLKTDWARKGLWGVEVPISSIASKLTAKGKGSSSKGGGGQ